MGICLGYRDSEKVEVIQRYCVEHQIQSVKIVTGQGSDFSAIPNSETIEWPNQIEYTYYFRWLQTITTSTLVVLDECLRSQNRTCLEYNCLRLFLNNTHHQLIFQHLPIIDQIDDFMILVDLDTRSKWRGRGWGQDINPNILYHRDQAVRFMGVRAHTPESLQRQYDAKKEQLFNLLGLGDPHTIPRQLHLLGSPCRAKLCTDPNTYYCTRGSRLSINNLIKWSDRSNEGFHYCIVDFPHRFIDFSDFLYRCRQIDWDAVITDLKVDGWYLNRYTDWAKRLSDAYAAIS